MAVIQRFAIIAAIVLLNGLLLREYLIGRWDKSRRQYSWVRKQVQNILQFTYWILIMLLLYAPMILPGVLKDLSKDQERVQTWLLFFNLVGTLSLFGWIFFSIKKKLRVEFGQKVFGKKF